MRAVDCVTAIDVAGKNYGRVAGAQKGRRVCRHVRAEELCRGDVVGVRWEAGGVCGWDEEIIEAGGWCRYWGEVWVKREKVWV